MRNCSTLTLTFCVALSAACSAAKMSEGKKQEKSDKKKDSAEAEKADENVTPPIEISGAFLRCAEEAAPNTMKPDSLYGCRLSDASGAKSQIAKTQNLRFGWRTSGETSLKVLSRALSDDARYDAFFLFRASNATELTAELAKIRIVIEAPEADASRYRVAIDQALNLVIRPASEFPETRAADYEAIKTDMGSELDASNAPTPPIPE